MLDQPTEEEKILARIEKMLRMADRSAGNENEAATALAMAQQLADAYNIDIEGVRSRGGATQDKSKARDDKSFSGGLYPYQRKLFEAIAKLNHCLYWTNKGTFKGQKFEHRLVGSKLNVLLSRQMGDYLQSTVERLAREYAGHHTEYFTKRTHAFREGVIDRVIEKIAAKREQDLAEAKQKKAEQAVRAKHPGAATENALVTIDDVAQREAESNYDFQYGEGAWARRIAAKIAREERRRLAEEAAAKWELENPEAAARKKAEQAEEAAKYWRDYEKRMKRRKEPTPHVPKGRIVDATGYYAGRDAGANVSLDRQVSNTERKAIK